MRGILYSPPELQRATVLTDAFGSRVHIIAGRCAHADTCTHLNVQKEGGHMILTDNREVRWQTSGERERECNLIRRGETSRIVESLRRDDAIQSRLTSPPNPPSRFGRTDRQSGV